MYNGHAPKALALGHLVNVNPQLETSPGFTEDRRRGFMFASVSAVNDAGLKWASLDEPNTCAYVWGRDINATSLSTYTKNKNLFTEPGEDFWKTSYLAHRLGEVPFSIIWNARYRDEETIYASLIYAVNDWSRSIPGWSVLKLKKLALYDCPHVFELARRGGSFLTEGYGIQPVLNKTNMKEIMLQG